MNDDKVRIRSKEELDSRKKCFLEIVDILEENKINFFIQAGTVLGAKRENNFIKWDWDVEFGIFEDEFILSFHDINPQKKIHALVIPKGKYIDLDDFSINASSEEMVGLLKGINKVAKKLGISTEIGKGYRALANISDHGGQEVPHLHFHLFGGEDVGRMVE